MNCYKCATPIPDNSRFCLSCGADVSGEGQAQERTLAIEADPELMAKLQADIGSEYVIEKELGRGGMAIVYLGHDAHLGRKVAVKLLPPEITYSAGTQVIERFRREARTAATLDHPNIIPVYRVSQGQKLFWYVMKYLEGEALDSVLKREGQLDVQRTTSIIKQTADALEYAHQHQIVHRDVKPANVMLDSRDRVTVTDFGIAKALDANTLTASGSMIGTPYYMSPEQCSGKRVGPASDQYSLAVMAYQMLGGHLPFTGESLIDIVRKHCMDPVPPLGVLRPQLPPGLVAVVEKGLAKDPEERFATVSQFAAAFEAAAKGLDVTLAPPSRPARQRLSETALVSPIPGALRTARGKVGGRRVAIVSGVVLLVAGGAALGILRPWHSREPGAEPQPTARQPVPPAGATQTPLLDTASRADLPVVAASPPQAADSPAAAAGAAQPARVTLRNVPAGATITRNGVRVSSPRFALEPNQRHVIRVQAAGFEPWEETVRLAAGQTRALTVTLRRAQATAASPGAAAPPAAQPAQTQPQVQPQPQPAQPAPQPAAPAAQPAVGYLFVGSTPATASITINGQVARSNPVTNYEVPAGSVTIVFRWTDTGGVPRDTTITLRVSPGETVRRRVNLPVN